MELSNLVLHASPFLETDFPNLILHISSSLNTFFILPTMFLESIVKQVDKEVFNISIMEEEKEVNLISFPMFIFVSDYRYKEIEK